MYEKCSILKDVPTRTSGSSQAVDTLVKPKRDIVEKLEFGCPFKSGTIGEKDAELAEVVMQEGANEISKLRAEVERLTAAHEKLRSEHQVCVEQLVLAYNGTVEAEAERDRFKAALERLVVTAPREHYSGDHGMGRWETCETCENIIDLAKETLAEAVRP